MKIGIYSVSTDPQITQDLLGSIASTIAKQVAGDFGAMWEERAIEIAVFNTVADLPSDYCPFVVKDALDVPNALADHSTSAVGRPILEAGWGPVRDNGGTLTSGALSLSVSMSHEVLECIADPYCDFYAPFPDPHGGMVCLEVCDPVEGDSYDIDGISVSNFVGPRWFSQGVGPYDQLGKLSAPFTMSPGGYLAFQDGTQIYGDLMPDWKRAIKASRGRSARRQAR